MVTRASQRRGKAIKAFANVSPRIRMPTQAITSMPTCKTSKVCPSPVSMSRAKVASILNLKVKVSKDPFANIEVNSSTVPTWADIFNVERMEAELVTMQAVSIANAYSEVRSAARVRLRSAGLRFGGRADTGEVVRKSAIPARK